jgi:hypothetical protein
VAKCDGQQSTQKYYPVIAAVLGLRSPSVAGHGHGEGHHR